MFNLGQSYVAGDGVPHDSARAAQLFQLAAQQDDASVQFDVALRYAGGKGVEQDEAEAARLFRLAAEHGHAGALCNYGMCLLHGKGVQQDHEAAVRYLQLAADKSVARAQFHLGTAFDKGLGVPQDYAQAARLYRLAASQGHAEASLLLGVLLVEGVPDQLAADPREAAQYLALAAQQTNDAVARHNALVALKCHGHERGVVSTCCIGCGGTRKLKLCTKCNVASFCGKECLARMWPVHKKSCKLWANG